MLSRENTAVSQKPSTTPAGRDPGRGGEWAARLAGVLSLQSSVTPAFRDLHPY